MKKTDSVEEKKGKGVEGKRKGKERIGEGEPFFGLFNVGENIILLIHSVLATYLPNIIYFMKTLNYIFIILANFLCKFGLLFF